MRKILAIIVCKILRVVGKMIGKGSSLPGKFALKICPDVLSRVKLPENIVAVTGSNGKTSTVEMMAHIFRENGKTVIYNAEGSNQIEGVTTFILANANLLGKVKGDVLLIESDERYAKYTFKYITPTYYVITNLYRDQLTRNGHPMWVYGAIKDSIKENSRLVLNADDPLVSLFGKVGGRTCCDIFRGHQSTPPKCSRNNSHSKLREKFLLCVISITPSYPRCC